MALNITCTGKQGPVPSGYPSTPCIACEGLILPGQYFTTIPIGCGSNPATRSLARQGMPFNVVSRSVHWACFMGDESESKLALV